MIEETKKSIQSILSQKISSPFYGTLIVSWLLWNWKIIYLTLFISEKTIDGNKIDFIVSNYNSNYHLIWFPLLSTAVILTIIPFVTNGAYWLDLNFDKWRIEKKHQIEKKQLLTIEQSISLRELIINTEKRIEELLLDKNNEIEQLKLLISEYEKKNPQDYVIEKNKENEIIFLAHKIFDLPDLKEANKIINSYIQGGNTRLVEAKGITSEILAFFDSNGLIESEKGIFKWTAKGKEVNKIISDFEFV